MWLVVFYVASLILTPGIRALEMTALQIPKHVVFNQTVTLECNFKLEQELLYSVKWYKDGHEFYRYVPKDQPPVQVFPVAGVSVAIRNSTEKSVVLNNVDLNSTGRYRCEVSAEAPSFQTVSDHADMVVFVLPDRGPYITGGRTRYQIDDVVRLNCTSARSKPAAILTWYINGERADPQYLKDPHITGVDERGLETATLGLEFRVKSKHFKRGDMKLKCMAKIESVYLQSNEESEEGDERILKALVKESRGTRAQSHTRNELSQGSSLQATAGWTCFFILAAIFLMR